MKGSFKVALVVIALASHIIGFYSIEEINGQSNQHVNITSIIFVLAVSVLLVEQNLIPKTSCPLPNWFINAYKIASVLFVTSVAHLYIWQRLCKILYNVNNAIVKALCNVPALKSPPLDKILFAIKSTMFLTLELLAISVYIFWVILKATGTYDRIQEWIEKMLNKNNTCQPEIQSPKEEECEEIEDEEDDEEMDQPLMRRSRRNIHL